MDQFDFIVVGGGSAGAVVANRLTAAAGVSVLVLEAGGNEVPADVAIPAHWPALLRSSIDWGYTSVPQPGLDGRSTNEPRGKLPGGSGNLYLMMHVRGHPADYDTWAYHGCLGWSFRDVLPYFQRIEDQEDDVSGLAGHGGPITVINAGRHNPNPTSAAFIEACVELGFPRTEDFNGTEMEGAGWHHLDIGHDGKRHDAAVGYLAPALGRPNLTLRTEAQATRLLFDGRRCTGVEYVSGGAKALASCRHEVIVCAGAMESPKLLMLSGIGPGAQLAQFGIPVLADRPGVGENFHNHVLTGLICESARPMEPPHLNLSESALFCKSGPGWVGPDLQLGFVHVPFDIIVGNTHPNSFTILPGVVRPMSRGWVRLASPDPLAKPLINPNYLAAEADLTRLVGAVELARKIFATRAFSEWVKSELMPGPGVGGGDALRDWVRHNADTYHHQVGSCKMGLDPMAVVDPDLRVFGVDGLRVADASVMPTVPSGNCYTGILMIGERVSDKIKATYRARFDGAPAPAPTA